MQIKSFTGVKHQCNNFVAIIVKKAFVIPYHGPVVSFKMKRFSRLEILTPVTIKSLQRKDPTSLIAGGKWFSSKFALLKLFVSFWVA